MSEHESELRGPDDDGNVYLWCTRCEVSAMVTVLPVWPSVEQISEAWAGHLQAATVDVAKEELAGRTYHDSLCTNTHSLIQCGRCLVLLGCRLEAIDQAVDVVERTISVAGTDGLAVYRDRVIHGLRHMLEEDGR